MSAEIIAFDRERERLTAPDFEAAWERYDVAAQEVQRLYRDTLSTREQRLAASINAVRLHRLFSRALEAL